MQRSQILVQNRVFCLSHLHSTPPLGGFPSEYRRPVWHGKLEWLGYPIVKKFRRYVYSFWHDPRTWQTDRQTNKQTDTACRHRPRLCIIIIIIKKNLQHRTARQKLRRHCYRLVHTGLSRSPPTARARFRPARRRSPQGRLRATADGHVSVYTISYRRPWSVGPCRGIWYFRVNVDEYVVWNAPRPWWDSLYNTIRYDTIVCI